MTRPTRSSHLVLTCLLLAGALGAAGTLVGRAALGGAADAGGIKAGAAAPAALTAAVGSEARHLILFSPACQWCHRQLEALARLGRVPDGIVVVVLLAPGEPRVAPDVADGVGVAFVARADLERDSGKLATPTHVWIDRQGVVTAVSVGFKSPEALADLYDAGARTAPRVQAEACGEAPCTPL